MRGSRLLVVIGIIVLVGAVAVGAILWIQSRSGEGDEEAEEPVAAEDFAPPATREVVLAAEDIPQNTRITSDQVRVESWPEQSVPEGVLTKSDIEEKLVGRIARVAILQDMPITEGMLTDSLSHLRAAQQIPSGKVAYALPVARYSSVAWAIQPGDHVDVLISLLVVELDEEFQTALPNSASCVQPPEGEGCQGGVMGRLEVLPNGWVVNLMPGEDQRARLVTQLTVQDAVVLRVGDWPGAEEAKPDEGQQQEQQEQQEEVVEEKPAPPPRAPVEPLTLVVTPQDAMVLKYAGELGASIDLVLRSAGDTDRTTTDSVTLQYLFDQFNIELPPKLPYGVTPPLQSVPSIVVSEVEVGTWGEPTEEY